MGSYTAPVGASWVGDSETNTAPLVWSRPLGSGRIVVNALGHDGQAIANPGFRQLSIQTVRRLLDGHDRPA